MILLIQTLILIHNYVEIKQRTSIYSIFSTFTSILSIIFSFGCLKTKKLNFIFMIFIYKKVIGF